MASCPQSYNFFPFRWHYIQNFMSNNSSFGSFLRRSTLWKLRHAEIAIVARGDLSLRTRTTQPLLPFSSLFPLFLRLPVGRNAFPPGGDSRKFSRNNSEDCAFQAAKMCLESHRDVSANAISLSFRPLLYKYVGLRHTSYRKKHYLCSGIVYIP